LFKEVSHESLSENLKFATRNKGVLSIGIANSGWGMEQSRVWTERIGIFEIFDEIVPSGLMLLYGLGSILE